MLWMYYFLRGINFFNNTDYAVIPCFYVTNIKKMLKLTK